MARTCDFGFIKNISSTFSTEDTLSMYRKSAISRQFEIYVQKMAEQNKFKVPIYLCLGQEFVAAAVATAYSRCSLFAQHRCHGWYLSCGGDMGKLVDELLGKGTGCCNGLAASASICSAEIGMYGHSGLLGDQIPIAVGAAVGGMERVVSVAGDAAVEEDYALAAYGFAASKKLPILFICEDNGLSILTKTETRRSWDICDVVRGFGIPAFDITDDPWLIMHYIRKHDFPLFLNIRTCRKLWHSGYGCDGDPEWDRLEMVKAELNSLGLSDQAEKIEAEAMQMVGRIWEEQLQKL